MSLLIDLRPRTLVPLATVFALLAGCSGPDSAASRSTTNGSASITSTENEESVSDQWTPTRLDSDHLPNAYRLTDKVISGGLPEDADAFQELANLGIKTIISVDGAQPNLELAHHFGLRYVHLPHGYDGVPDDRAKELAKAVLELEGPIYIHCHHGKHRSPAAAAVACVGAGFLRPDVALNILHTAGTSEHYQGLYDSAGIAHRFDRALLDQLQTDFPESVEVAPMAEAMVKIEHTLDRIKQIRDANWSTPEKHPDIGPAHEALMLREHFTELLRTDEVQEQDEAFHSMLEESEATAESLESLLRKPSDQRGLGEMEAAYQVIVNNCTSCHVVYRDTPRVHGERAGGSKVERYHCASE